MSSINFFGWIRDGVRQSVLLGVSDAIDQLGTPPSTDELHPDVVAFLQNGAPAAAAAGVAPKLTGNPARALEQAAVEPTANALAVP